MRKKLSVFLVISFVLPILGLSSVSGTAAGADRLEIEDVTDASLVEDANTSGGRFQLYKTTSPEEVVQQFTYEAEAAGYYQIRVACAPNSAARPFLSPMSIRVNGGDYILLSDQTCTQRKLADFANTSFKGTFDLYEYTLRDEIYLKAGSNTLDLKATTRIAGPGVPSEGIYFALDYVEISRAEAPEPPAGRGKVEIEDITSEYLVADANTSGGKFQIYKSTSTEPVVQRFSFEIEESGPYTISVACANFSNMPYLSQLFFSANGGKYVELSDETCTVTQLPELADAGMRETFNLYCYVCNTDLYLEKGVADIDIQAIARTNSAATPGVYFSLDYVEVKPVKKLTGLRCETENGFVKFGRQQPLTIRNEDGVEITAADVTSIQYSSSDPTVAYADPDGIIHGRNFGRAVITAKLDRKGELLTASCPVFVTDQNSLILSDAKRTGGTVTVTVQALQEYSSDDYIMIAVYGTKNGYPTSVKRVYRVAVPNLHADENVELRQAVEAGKTDQIGIFLINSRDDGSTAYSKISL